jgi:hypothetical protein
VTQAADIRPEPNLQRKAAIANAGARDHRGKVRVTPIPKFDLNRTIFQTLESPIARYIQALRIGKDVAWTPDAAAVVEDSYRRETAGLRLPDVDPALMAFLRDDCDFDVEHADGSFLDHLYFCFEYTAKHYPEGSALAMFLHSILGTGTNTFAMEAAKIPRLQALLEPRVFAQVEAFPSLLRLLYSGELRAELRAALDRNPRPEVVRLRMHRVIDNAPIELDGPAFWEAMNYQLVHLVDFLPVANWAVHQNDTSYILFRDVFDLMGRWDRRVARVTYEGPVGSARLENEPVSLGGWLATKVPPALAEKMAAKSVRRFSERCGHSLRYELELRPG